VPGTQAVIPMDVDDGGFLLFTTSLSTSLADAFADVSVSEVPSPKVVIPKVPAQAATGKKTVRLLPYVEVPNMDTTSHMFRKAEATVSKQSTPSSSGSTGTSTETFSSAKSGMDCLFNVQQGM
jgi:hypothetical protein